MKSKNQDINGFPIIGPEPEQIVQEPKVIPSKPIPMESEVVPTHPLPIQDAAIAAIEVNGDKVLVENKVAKIPNATTEQYGTTILNEAINSTSNTQAATPSAINTLREMTERLIADLNLRMPKIYYDTKAHWDAQRDLVSENKTLYVYTDYQSSSGKPLAGFKVGDGQAYLIDLPFVDEMYYQHINDTTIHITQEEREFWNSKWSGYMSQVNEEQLIFTTN